MGTTKAPVTSASLPARRGLIFAIGLNVVLVVLLSGLALYAFMLNVDMGDLKRRMSMEVETRQQTERVQVELRNQLTERQREIAQLKSQLAYKERDYQVAVAAKPALPVVVNFRSSILGKGLVAVIENVSNRYLAVVLSVRHPNTSRVRRFKVDLEPQSKTDFGHLEGWEFVSGDNLSLINNEFGVLTLSVP